jgi:hypothetical protein
MQQIQLADKVYKDAQRRAAEAGFASVDEYVADVLINDVFEDGGEETPDLEHLFTPERLAKIDAALADVKAGHFLTSDQVDAELAKCRDEWVQNKSRQK